MVPTSGAFGNPRRPRTEFRPPAPATLVRERRRRLPAPRRRRAPHPRPVAADHVSPHVRRRRSPPLAIAAPAMAARHRGARPEPRLASPKEAAMPPPIALVAVDEQLLWVVRVPESVAGSTRAASPAHVAEARRRLRRLAASFASDACAPSCADLAVIAPAWRSSPRRASRICRSSASRSAARTAPTERPSGLSEPQAPAGPRNGLSGGRCAAGAAPRRQPCGRRRAQKTSGTNVCESIGGRT